MSQAGEVNSGAGPVPPVVATSYVTDINSPAIPAANILNVPGGTVTTSNDKGIQTDGSSGGNTLTVELTNRIIATGTTTDAVTPLQLINFALGAAPGTYLFEISVVGYNVTSSLSAAYKDFVTIRTTGAAAVFINSLATPALNNEEGVMDGIELGPGVSGNNFTFTITNGLAASTIDWKVLVTYIKVN